MAKSYKKWLKRAKKNLEKRIEREGKPIVLLKFILPIFLAFVATGIFYSLGPDIYIALVQLLGIYMLAPIGSGIGIPIGFEMGINNAILIFFMLTIDMLTSMFIIWNFDYIKIIPVIGKLVKKTEEKAMEIRKKSQWIKKLEFIGISTFVFLPLYGTGSVIGSVIGKLLEMNPWRIWAAVILGSLSRNILLILILEGIVKLL